MDKTYIGTIELNNGSVTVGNAMSQENTYQVVPIYKGVYHCYTYVDEIGKTYIGVEYGGSLDTSNDFQEIGSVTVTKMAGIFETAYYNVYKKSGQLSKWDEKVNSCLSHPVKILNNRAIFASTFNQAQQEAVVFTRNDKKGFCVELKMSYVANAYVEEPENCETHATLDCTEEVIYDMDACIEDPEVHNYYEVEQEEQPTPPTTETNDSFVTTCAECNQVFFKDEENHETINEDEEKGDEVSVENLNEHIVETLYYDFTVENNPICEIVKPRMNEIVKDLLGGETPPTLWYRGLTVEKVNGKIHKLTFDFD